MPQEIEVDPAEVQSVEIDPSELERFDLASQGVMTVNVPGKPPMQVYRPSSEPGALFPPSAATQQVLGTEQPSVFDQPKSVGETVVQEGFVNPAKQAWSAFTQGGANLMHLGANLTQAINQDLTDLGLGPAEQRKVLTTVENWFRGQQAGGEQAAAQLAGGRTDFPSQLNRAIAGGVANLPPYIAGGAALGLPAGMATVGGLQNVHLGPGATLKGMAEGAVYGTVAHVMGPAGRSIRLPGNAATAYTQAKKEGASEEEAWAAAFTGGIMGEMGPGGGPGARYMARNIPRPGVRNVLTPEAQSSQRFMTERGIQTPLSMQTGSKAAGSLEATTQNLPGGGRFHETMLESQRKLREEVAPGVMAEISPGEKLTQEEVGTSVQTALEQNLSQRQAELGGLVHREPVTPEEIGTTLKQTLGTGLERTRTGLAEEVLPGQPMTPEAAGTAVLERGKQEIRQFNQAADESYKAAWEAERNPRNIERVPTGEVDEAGNPVMRNMALPIDRKPLQEALKPLAAKYEYTLSATDAHASLGLKAMRQIIEGDRYVPASAAETDLGMLKEAARTEKGLAELRDPSQGLAAKAVAELQSAIDAKMANAHYSGWDPGSGGSSPALRHLQAGRKATAQKYDIEDRFRIFGPNLEKAEPVAAFRGLTWEGDAGIERLRKIAEIAPEQMPQVGRAFIEGGGDWKKLGPESKKILFKDEGIIKGLDQYYAEEAKFGPLTKLEPVVLFERLTAKSGKRINLLQDVLDKYPQHREQIGRAFIDSGGNWGALDAKTRTALFKDRALIGSLDEYYANQAKFGPLLKLEPVNLFKRMTAPGGTRINLTQEILAQTPQLRGQIGRAFFEGLFDTATREGDIRNVQSTLDTVLKMDDKTLTALVPDPKIRQNMKDLFLSMKRLVANPNPSGSGLIAALTKMKGNIFSGLGAIAGYGGHGYAGPGLGGGAEGLLAGAAIEYGSNAALAHLLFNQKFINMLNRGIKAELQGDNASGRLAARTLKKIIDENPPPEGPPEGPGTLPINPPGGGEGPPPSTPGTGGGRAAGGAPQTVDELARNLYGKPYDELTGSELARIHITSEEQQRIGRGGAGTGKGEPLSIYDSLQKAGDEARERFKKGWSTQYYSLFPGDKALDLATMTAAGVTKGVKSLANRAMNDMGEWGAARIAGGYIKYKPWSEQMLKDAEEIHPQAVEFLKKNLRAIYKASQQTYSDRKAETITGKISDIEKILRYAEEGKEGTYWYKNVRPKLKPIFGENTDLFLNFLAATSPRTPVADNVARAITAYNEYLGGKQFSTDFKAHLLNLGRATRGEPLSGLKVGSFSPNLLGDFIRVTVDTWMAQAYGFKGDVTDPQYRFMDYAISQAAKAKGLKPAEMQAAIWTGIKKLEGDPRLTAEPFEVIVEQYLKENPDIAKAIEKAIDIPALKAREKAIADKRATRKK